MITSAPELVRFVTAGGVTHFYNPDQARGESGPGTNAGSFAPDGGGGGGGGNSSSEAGKSDSGTSGEQSSTGTKTSATKLEHLSKNGAKLRGLSPKMESEVVGALNNCGVGDSIEKFDEIQAHAFGTRKYDPREDAVAAMRGNTLLLNTRILGTPEKFDEYQKLAQASREQVANNLDKLSPRQQEVAREILSYKRDVVPETMQDYITHEVGHHIDHTAFRAGVTQARDGRLEHPQRKTILANRDKYIPSLSHYASTSGQEYIAESFTAWRKGESIDPMLSDMFKEATRKK